MKKKIVRITLEVDEKLRSELKVRAARKYVTLKNWILSAIVKAMVEESELKEGVYEVGNVQELSERV